MGQVETRNKSEERGSLKGLELEEEPEIKVEEDTEEEMQGDASSEEAPENPEDFDGEKPHAEPEEITEEFTGTILTPDNADSLFGDTPEDEQLIREIEEGEIVGFAPASLTDIGETELMSETGVKSETGLIPETSFQEGLPIRHVLSNSFGFGGNDSSLLFSATNFPKRTNL